MNLTGNTILITGGGTGIGRALAEALHARGNEVHIVGRRQSVLDEVVAANPGMLALSVDIETPEGVAELAARAGADLPYLNVLINNAGIMRMEDLAADTVALETMESTIATNLLGPLRLTAALLPLLRRQPRATVAAVTSGLAFVPMAATPTYCATKAALHSWLQSLRYQLRGTAVEVLEIAPPYVQTGLMRPEQAEDPNAMPLAEYIAETISLLEHPPTSGEILVNRVKPLRSAETSGHYEQVFGRVNSLPH